MGGRNGRQRQDATPVLGQIALEPPIWHGVPPLTRSTSEASPLLGPTQLVVQLATGFWRGLVPEDRPTPSAEATILRAQLP